MSTNYDPVMHDLARHEAAEDAQAAFDRAVEFATDEHEIEIASDGGLILDAMQRYYLSASARQAEEEECILAFALGKTQLLRAYVETSIHWQAQNEAMREVRQHQTRRNLRRAEALGLDY